MPAHTRPPSARKTPRAKAEEQSALEKQLHKQQMKELQSQDSEEDEEGEGGEKAKGNHKRGPPQGWCSLFLVQCFCALLLNSLLPLRHRPLPASPRHRAATEARCCGDGLR